ncbi:hypothetical protein MTR_5g047220 [Medicago truncatula]|nr:hypothetical protein MTR_5g047220 [Medicago truncatula]
MKESVNEFPGFQIYNHRDELVFRNSTSRLQKRAPCPLQINPNMKSSSCNGTQNLIGNGSTSSSLNSFFNSKGPIPLLSPLVVLESTSIREENPAKSH